ncbi:unnamed protein product [Lampetra fluviatilis]
MRFSARCCATMKSKSMAMFSGSKFVVSVTLFGLSAFVAATAAYKPIVIVHGLFGKPCNFLVMARRIEQAHPGTEVSTISLYDGYRSLAPMWDQARGLIHKMQPIMSRAPQGVHLLCYSQGGLLCRAALSLLSLHNVDTFISLASPQMGQYGGKSLFQKALPMARTHVHNICYNGLGQRLSICNYWNDPLHQEKFETNSKFLAVINNQTHSPHADAWKRNFLRINNLVMVGGPGEDVVMPWQSSFFETYDEHLGILGMTAQEVYTQDSFGLRTLDEAGNLTKCVVPYVRHLQFPFDRYTFEKCILQWLT